MTKEEIFDRFNSNGFPKVSMNLWKNDKLYINIKGLPPICFDLTRSYGKQTYDCRISCNERLDPSTFRRLANISAWLRPKADELRALFAENKTTYISNK